MIYACILLVSPPKMTARDHTPVTDRLDAGYEV